MSGTPTRVALITGGAGFIGSNLAERLLSEGDVEVRVFDNFSRHGVQHNLSWLTSLAGREKLEVVEGDVRKPEDVNGAMSGVTEVYHLAAQVAVTTSLEDPVTDFEVNALGTFNVLEAARNSQSKPFLLYTSTNKVYGALERIAVELSGSHYRAQQRSFRGVTEQEPLDFHSPYGCSKGAADQYVRDYARIYDLPTVVFRMSCIAGPRQFGNEDQGWVAHFLYSVMTGRVVTIYGDGFQVRDVLHVHDLIDAMQAARTLVQRTRGEVYNLGGGMERTVSVIELLKEVERRTGSTLHLDYSPTRPGDQPLYISDSTKLQLHTGWRPRRSLSSVYEDILQFWLDNREAVSHSMGNLPLTAKEAA